MSWQLGAFTVLVIALASGFAWYERVDPDARIVALVGTLAAFAALGRIAFAAVPNVKPTTDIVLIAGYALGGGPGFAVGALAGLTSNFFFGQGPWTPWQMAAWGATGVFGAGLARVWSAGSALGRRRRAGPAPAGRDAPAIGRWPLALACCVAGFAFTVVQDAGDWVTFSDHSSRQLDLYVARGLGFDAVHAGGCLLFALALGPALARSIQRFARRLQVTWLPPGGVAASLILVTLLPAVTLGFRVPAARAAGAGGPAAAAASYLLRAENRDGGFGAAPGLPSNQLYAGWAALGLASAGYDLNRVAHGGPSVVTFVRGASGFADTGSLERTILVARAAGLSVRDFAGHDLIGALERRLGRDGSISDQVNLTSFAVLALRGAGARPRSSTISWLVRRQDRDGGFSFAGTGGSSDVDDTGAVLEALAGERGAAVGARARAVAFLRRQQDRDGGFASQPGGASNAQSTAWAVQGLIAAGVPPSTLHRAGAVSPPAYLSSLVAPSGAVRYARGVEQTPVWVTGEALMALEARPLPLAPRAPSSALRARRAAPTAATGSARTSTRRAPPRAATRRRPGRRPPGSRDAHVLRHRLAIPTGTPASSVSGLAVTIGMLTALALAPMGLG